MALRILASTLAMGLLVYELYYPQRAGCREQPAGATSFAGTIALGAALYLVLIYLFKIEVGWMFGLIKRKIASPQLKD